MHKVKMVNISHFNNNIKLQFVSFYSLINYDRILIIKIIDYSPGPHAPVYYPPQNYINHSMYTNDSGVSEVPYAAHPYYAQVYQQPGPIYYPQTPQVPPIVHSHQVVTTPIIQHPVQAPVYPVAVSQNVNGVTGEEDGEVVTSSSGVVASTNLDVQAEASNADA